ncbi:MAG TPA: Flp family type IVb pilin [Polyangiaceae bacterium]|nr:Flp family type IVb pilin [Polyangiaceae bacterium]
MATLTAPTTNESKSSIVRDDRGLSTVEYVILLVLIAVGGIFLWNKLGDTVMTKVQNSDTRLGGELNTEKKEPGTQ